MQELDKPLKNLLGLDTSQLETFFAELGEKPFRAKQVLRWIHQRGVTDFDLMSDLSKSLRETLKANCCVKPLDILGKSLSSDGTCKWLFALPEGGAIETVFIPERNRATLCISSQVGCSLNCRFCYTATQGCQRDLTSHEIIGQIWTVYHELLQNEQLIDGVRPITNIVLMGMGEPLMNRSQVFPALKIMRDDLAYGFSKWRVTVSTSGVVPGIDALEDLDVALALSLHAPNDALRSEIVPLNKKYPIQEVLDACNRYVDRDPRRMITMEYVMLDGVNDKIEHAKELCRVLSKVPCKINLIPFNPFPGNHYKCSPMSRIEDFKEQLRKGGFITTIRKTRGQDIVAACGQLAGQVKDRTKRQSKWKSALPKDTIIPVMTNYS